eukprot:g13702.t1
MEQELAALKQQLADTKEDAADFEKKVEIEAAKLRARTKDQLDSTTKRTIMENEQMFTELHFQSKETEKLMERRLALVRTHLYQRLLKKMDQKLKSEASQKETSTQGKSMESVMEQENPLTGLRECEGYSRRAEAKSESFSIGGSQEMGSMNISSEEYSRVQRQMEDHQSTLQMVRHEFAQYRRDHATLAQLQDQSTRLIISALYELKQQKEQGGKGWNGTGPAGTD